MGQYRDLTLYDALSKAFDRLEGKQDMRLFIACPKDLLGTEKERWEVTDEMTGNTQPHPDWAKDKFVYVIHGFRLSDIDPDVMRDIDGNILIDDEHVEDQEEVMQDLKQRFITNETENITQFMSD